MRQWVEKVSIAIALLGGAVVSVLILVICMSVVGRALGTAAIAGVPGLGWAGAVRGDLELVEAGLGFAIFAFLPLCQLRGGHAVVDLVTAQLPARVTRSLAVFWDGVFALVLGLIAWRLGIAVLDKMCIPARFTGAWCSVETSFLMEFPIWWSYLPAWIACVWAACVAVYCTGYRARHGALPPHPDEDPVLASSFDHGGT